jgi:hypothetical protein
MNEALYAHMNNKRKMKKKKKEPRDSEDKISNWLWCMWICGCRSPQASSMSYSVARSSPGLVDVPG